MHSELYRSITSGLLSTTLLLFSYSSLSWLGGLLEINFCIGFLSIDLWLGVDCNMLLPLSSFSNKLTSLIVLLMVLVSILAFYLKERSTSGVIIFYSYFICYLIFINWWALTVLSDSLIKWRSSSIWWIRSMI